ncbi:hypoxanthine-guanine phosphoribosyltransferase [Wolffia australiana]
MSSRQSVDAAMALREEDMERILWTDVEISARVSELAEEMSEVLRDSEAAVVFVGIATGSFMFLADVARRITIPIAVDLVRVESYGLGTESGGAPRLTTDLKIDVRGKHVVLVEDIVDTGNTLFWLIAHMKSKGASSVSVCTFLDKPSRRKVIPEPFGEGRFYRGFECPDNFVVGYGMDFAELYRNLPYIGVLKKEKYQL